jgi:competence protein ComEC
LPVVLGAASLALHDPPQIIVSSDARLVAVAAPDGGYAFSSSRVNRFEAEIWMRRAGQEVPLDWPDEGLGLGGRLICDAIGCLYRADGQIAAIAWRAAALADDCAIAGLVLSLEPARDLCGGSVYVIDRFDIWRNGAYAIWIDRDGFRTQSVAETRGERPWVADSERRTGPDD